MKNLKKRESERNVALVTNRNNLSWSTKITEIKIIKIKAKYFY